MNIVNNCFDILAGALPPSPIIADVICKKMKVTNKTSYKIGLFTQNYFGANFGVLAYRGFVLCSEGALSGRAKLISLAIGLGGAAFTIKVNNSKETVKNKGKTMVNVIVVQNVANVILGLGSLYCGQYAFALSALGSSGYALKVMFSR